MGFVLSHSEFIHTATCKLVDPWERGRLARMHAHGVFSRNLDGSMFVYIAVV
jgi:hypothetical protein